MLDPSVAMNDGILTTTVKNALNRPDADRGEECDAGSRGRRTRRALIQSTATMFVLSPYTAANERSISPATITSVRPKPMIAIELRPRRIPKQIAEIEQLPVGAHAEVRADDDHGERDAAEPGERAARPAAAGDARARAERLERCLRDAWFMSLSRAGRPGAQPGPPRGRLRCDAYLGIPAVRPGQGVLLEVRQLARPEARFAFVIACSTWMFGNTLPCLHELRAGDRAERGLLRPVLVEEGDLGAGLDRGDLVGRDRSSRR